MARPNRPASTPRARRSARSPHPNRGSRVDPSRRPYNRCMEQTPHRAGHVAVIGRPNVGKSTLTNALVGAKVSIVSSRPQTTRHRLLDIATFPEGQLVLVDTPGLHRDHGRSDRKSTR